MFDDWNPWMHHPFAFAWGRGGHDAGGPGMHPFFNFGGNARDGNADNEGDADATGAAAAAAAAGDHANEDFTPEMDVFDTETSFVVHVSLAGVKKEDVGVSWDAEKSELSVAGVIHRPGDEEFLKTFAMGDRKVGPFEKKIRLGSRANPAQVDADLITAKLEDGVLRVDVPKLDKDYIEIKKVDIE